MRQTSVDQYRETGFRGRTQRGKYTQKQASEAGLSRQAQRETGFRGRTQQTNSKRNRLQRQDSADKLRETGFRGRTQLTKILLSTTDLK